MRQFSSGKDPEIKIKHALYIFDKLMCPVYKGRLY